MAPSALRHNYTRCLCIIVTLLSLVQRIHSLAADVYNTSFDGVTWDNTNWILETTNADPGHYQSRANLANGYIGINVASIGPFFEVDVPVDSDNINGWPLFDRRQSFATVGGFFDVQPTTNGTNYEWLNQLGGESVISGLPHWSGLLMKVNGHVLDATTDLDQISDFSSKLDMKNGQITWDYAWTPPGSCALRLQYVLFLNKLNVNQAVTRLNIMSTEDVTVNVIDAFQGDAAVRTFPLEKQFDADTAVIWSAVQPDNIPYVTAYVYSHMVVPDDSMAPASLMQVDDARYIGDNSSGIAQQVTLNVKARALSAVEKHVGIASTDAFDDPMLAAIAASKNITDCGFEATLKAHQDEWHAVFTPESVDDFSDPGTGKLPMDVNIVEEQILSVTNPFFLLQNLVSPNAVEAANNNTKLATNSISVGGLSSSSYAGLVFWDVEVWMAPGLTVTFPDQVKQIPNYRLERYAQAQRNIEEAYTSSQNMTGYNEGAAIFPWTSGRFGNCTGTGPCFDYEYHINGDISLELENYFITSGDAQSFEEDYLPIITSITQTYSNLLYHNTSTDQYSLQNATDPDEYANMIDNPGYTQVLIQRQLNNSQYYAATFGSPYNMTWFEQAQRVLIPTSEDADIILEYTGMNGSISVKQADVVLVDDFLDWQNPYTLSDFDFYAGHQSLNGPGMTYGVFSIIAAAAAQSGCAEYSYDLYSSRPYRRAPFYQFSEQLLDDYTANGGTHPAYPFLTGMGGAYRVVPFGYLGLRLRFDTLNVNPSSPPQIQNIKYRTIYWQGHAVSAVSNTTHTTLNLSPQLNIATANQNFSTGVPVTVGFDSTVHNLTTAAPLILPNRQTYLNITTPGNILQCAPAVSSDSDYLPGQFPLSAVDGGLSTAWRAANPNITSTLIVDRGEGFTSQAIGSLGFDWGQNPPVSYAVYFSNSSTTVPSPDVREVYSEMHVTVSSPYIAATVDRLVPYGSNTTMVELDGPVWSGRYAILAVTGNQNTLGDGGGAAVSEFDVIVA